MSQIALFQTSGSIKDDTSHQGKIHPINNMPPSMAPIDKSVPQD